MIMSFSVMPGTTQAADVYVKPAVGVEISHDDNVRLDPVEQDNQTLSRLTAQAEIGSKTRVREAVLDARTRVNRYSDSDLNSTDWYLDFGYLRRLQRDELGFKTGYKRESTITSELEDTGRVRDAQPRDEWNFAPYWTHQLSRLTETTLRYEYRDVGYKDASETGLFGFRQHYLEPSITHQLNRTTKLFGRVDYTRFESDSEVNTDNVGVLVGAEWEVSRTFRAGLGLGGRYTKSDIPVEGGATESDSSNGYLFDLHATWTLEKSTFAIEAGRTVEPSGLGVLSEADRVGAKWRQVLTRAWALKVNASALRRRYSETQAQTQPDRTYYLAEAGLEWRPRPRWEADLMYRYRRQEFDEPPVAEGGSSADSAHSNSVWLTVRYTWQPIDVSR